MVRRQILLNAVKCLVCEDIVQSTRRHDYRNCFCGNIVAGGGLDYIRRTFITDEYIEMSQIKYFYWEPETRKLTYDELIR